MSARSTATARPIPHGYRPPIPMLSSMALDDDDDALERLAASTLAPWRARDDAYAQAYTSALEALPSALVAASLSQSASPGPRPRPSRAAAWGVHAVLAAAACALLVLLSALAWRATHPHDAVAAGSAPATARHTEIVPDVISGASR
ncbi:MAG: hypothetical protein K1X88_30445 [Nannocystaceae bacterium]|nr:hypothetical protein [Nannocystaceae bacterium]